MKTPARTPDGKTIPFLTMINPFKDDKGTIIGIIEDFRDITKHVKEKKETEKYKKVAIGQNLGMIRLRDKIKELISELD